MTKDVREAIKHECKVIEELLLDKNEKYGNSALQPKRIFSRASSIEGIKVRIDDKISRISNMSLENLMDEDTVVDLIGYLILFRIANQAVKAQLDDLDESILAEFSPALKPQFRSSTI